MKKQTNRRKLNGFSILEVVIGIFIFVVGMLALAALQGALTRSMADAKLRTTAVNLADRALERQRGFTQILTAVIPGTPFAYNDITSTDIDIPRNGVTYTVDMDVTDYYYQLASDTFTTIPTLGASSSNYKQVDVTVSWDAVQDFRAGEGVEIASGDLNTGSVTLTNIVPAIITSASGRVSDESDGGELEHTITYTPGLNPDIVALDLGGSKFKESLLPEPDVIRSDELVQTTFDVVTYSQANGTTFLRREEFAAVSCECTLRTTAGSARRPLIWAGDEYAAGHFVDKPYGESADNQQSSLCDSCCRDHHDGGSDGQAGDSDDEFANVFGPFKEDDEYLADPRLSDHVHYQDDAVTPAGDGDDYLETCRLVRKDGFFRVAQDFRREDQYVFPPDFLDDATEVEEFETYSGYVTSAAAAYTGVAVDGYPTGATPCIGLPGPCVKEPTMQVVSDPRGVGELPSWTSLVTDGIEQKQLRSRGIYIDYMSNDLRLFLNNCFDGDVLKNDCCIRGGEVASSCTGDDLYIDKTISARPLEVIPFFEVQMTRLENWSQTNQAILPISLTNEALADANAHSRGEIAQIALGETDVESESHRGNIGFTNTLPIDPVFELANATLHVQSLDAAGGGGGGGGALPIMISGSFTENVRGNPTIEVEGIDDVICTLEPGGYSCSVDADAASAVIRVSGYTDVNPGTESRFACSDELLKVDSHSNPREVWAEFDLFTIGGDILPADTVYDIRIQKDVDC